MIYIYFSACTYDSPFLFGDNCYRIYTGSFAASSNPCPYGGTLAMPKTSAINQYLYNINFG